MTNNPLRGFADWDPREYKVRKYIFGIWRKVCTSYGYKEYLAPLFEPADLYRAKSGDELGGKELLVAIDRAGRELAMRPEMTPSVTRMISKVYSQLSKPIRWFSIANFVRNQKPQKGRNREFWQLNYDIFGDDSIYADIEIIDLFVNIMNAFNVKPSMYSVYINNRKLVDKILTEVVGNDKQNVSIMHILDKKDKLSSKEFNDLLSKIGLSARQIDEINKFMTSNNKGELVNNFSFIEDSQDLGDVVTVLEFFGTIGLKDTIVFAPNVIRGLDYYDGIVFEVFDKTGAISRALMGGGRYNGMASLFGGTNFPAVGAGAGDEPLRIFLAQNSLLPEIKGKPSIYVPILDCNDCNKVIYNLVIALRKKYIVVMGTKKQNVSDAIRYAVKNSYDAILLMGDDEAQKGIVTIKNLGTRQQQQVQTDIKSVLTLFNKWFKD